MANLINTDTLDNILELQLNVLVFQEGEYYVAYCPSVNLSSYGDSVEDAKTGFDEVMQAYLEDHKEDGSLQEDLIRHGWKIHLKNNGIAVPPATLDLNIQAGVLRRQFNENWKVVVN